MSYATDISESEARRLADSLTGPLQAFEVFPGISLKGAYNPGMLWPMLQLEGLCAGKRILEIGPAEGFFSKRLAENGAVLTCMDYQAKDKSGFWVMERLSGRTFDFVQGNVMDGEFLASLGMFDIVLFMGVLYHLPDPMRALDNIRSVCSGSLYLETLCDTELPADIPAARYFHSNSQVGDWTNFWAPNRVCVEGMLLDNGFAVKRVDQWGDRLLLACDIITTPDSRYKADLAYSRQQRG